MWWRRETFAGFLGRFAFLLGLSRDTGNVLERKIRFILAQRLAPFQPSKRCGALDSLICRPKDAAFAAALKIGGMAEVEKRHAFENLHEVVKIRALKTGNPLVGRARNRMQWKGASSSVRWANSTFPFPKQTDWGPSCGSPCGRGWQGKKTPRAGIAFGHSRHGTNAHRLIDLQTIKRQRKWR